VIGSVPGTEFPDELGVAGNHRDAWVYGAVDPTAATGRHARSRSRHRRPASTGMEARKRRIVFCSWDAEEEASSAPPNGPRTMPRISPTPSPTSTPTSASPDPNFEASAVPSLKEFVRDVAKAVPSPKGGTVYDQWKKSQDERASRRNTNGVEEHSAAAMPTSITTSHRRPRQRFRFTPFIQHLGVPSTDIGSGGPYGVYHSVFDTTRGSS